MTELHRTPLTTSQKVEFAALALAGQDSHGTVSALSREYAISRPTVYQARKAAVQVLTEHFTQEDGGGPRGTRGGRRGAAASSGGRPAGDGTERDSPD